MNKYRKEFILIILGTYILAVSVTFWPFHHKKPVQPKTPTYSQGTITVPDQPNLAVPLPRALTDNCFDLGDGYVLFSGPDGTGGVGSTCYKAYQDWRTEPAPPTKFKI